MKIFLRGLFRSFPIQLFLLHFKKFQVLLIFWFVLFSTVNGTFMKSFGADSLYLAPEYLGEVNALSAAFVGVAIGIFIMSWNITTFILFSRHFRFLATTSNPFLKYCINNGIIPLLFLGFYFNRAVKFAGIKELMTTSEITLLVGGFLGGLILIIAISFFYFFRADKTIIRRLTPVISNPQLFKAQFRRGEDKLTQSRLVKVEWYLNSLFTLKKVRDVSHYSREFVETIFNRHHFAAVLSIFVAFIFLIVMGFWLDDPLFQLPAACGITLFFSILIAVSGAFTYFMQSWSIPVLVLIFFVLNLLYRHNIIDPTNKAYGLNYDNKEQRPAYTRERLFELSSPERTAQDKEHMIRILDRWKARQDSKKPVMFIINTSGGGNRSATFTMNVMQCLDSLSNGELMRKTAFITGASGGMLGAAYFRELSRAKAAGAAIRLQDDKYVDDISGDLLNALFTSFVARDLASPAQKFNVDGYQYVKDRGYAFEQKLNQNTHGFLNKQLKDLNEDEVNARTPLMLFSSVITQDSRKMLISTQPMSYLMKPVYDTNKLAEIEPDAVDYQSMFAGQDPMNLRLLTALRMNATFPYVLPNVWLPTNPVIDVMDAGLRDNYGLETTIRYLQVFQTWIRENTSGVVLIQIRDRKIAGWEPFEASNITEIATKPVLLLQHNWYKMQEYSQNDLLCLSQQILGKHFYKLSFQYLPKKEDARAALNFHLTKSEKLDINEALFSANNQQSFQFFKELLKPRNNPPAK
ncbi:patatin-like phospholipase family protein [Paraflavitalea soli]|uniref:Patatin-like phospholipase family protein n=1 Tax=Paraflavitalea soli TaxID=2315862 RepID=A0A3B7N2G7_9BACT|nr:patatin-like phospholipase family protein [Paraflavitalea soli]AXY76531.1 patatin-like phospholipase family protein [Paraflavitalea soli]